MPMAAFRNPSTTPTAPGSKRVSRWRSRPACATTRLRLLAILLFSANGAGRCSCADCRIASCATCNEISFACMTELVFADRDDLSARMASLGADEISRDEENFIDRAATRAYVVDERSTAG